MKHACKFKRGDSITLIRTLETRSGARRKRVVYPKGTTFTIGDIRLRHRNVETSSDDEYELYNYTLVDEDNNTVAVVWFGWCGSTDCRSSRSHFNNRTSVLSNSYTDFRYSVDTIII
mgnify:CR=1 FL=1